MELESKIGDLEISFILYGEVVHLEDLYDEIIDYDIPIPDKIKDNMSRLWDKYEEMRPILTLLIYEDTKDNDMTDEYKQMLKKADIKWCFNKNKEKLTSLLFIEYIKLLQE